jgi:putative transposase
MANTYTQLHIQLVFAVKYRRALIDPAWSGDLHAYLTGIVQNNKHKMLQVNSMPDHIHALIGLRPHQAISALVQNVKAETSKWICKRGFCRQKFAWQEGFGAFSYSKSDVPHVIRYIINQQEHHRKTTFLEEYKKLLTEFSIDYDEQYIFTNPI